MVFMVKSLPYRGHRRACVGVFSCDMVDVACIKQES